MLWLAICLVVPMLGGLIVAWILIFRVAMRNPNKTSGGNFDPSGSWGSGTGGT
jgi:hypothetical protein